MEWYIKMNNKTKKDIRSKSRLARGLAERLGKAKRHKDKATYILLSMIRKN